MLNGNHDNEINTRSTTNIQEDDEDEDDDNDNDEDNTARIDRRRSLKGASQNIEALQRVKSLTHRNRMVSDIFQFSLGICAHFLAPLALDPQHVLVHLIPTMIFMFTNAFRNSSVYDSELWLSNNAMSDRARVHLTH